MTYIVDMLIEGMRRSLLTELENAHEIGIEAVIIASQQFAAFERNYKELTVHSNGIHEG